MNSHTMTTKIPIPKYDPEKSYDIYRAELELWDTVTDVSAEKKAACIILTLPCTGTCTIRTTVIQKGDKAKLNSATGFAELLRLLDELLGKDDLQDCVDKYDEFEDYHRTNETMREYVQVFDTKVAKLTNKSITLPQVVLAFKLIRNANISKEDKKLVLTGLNYATKDQLYDQAKSALKKYCGEGYDSACKFGSNSSVSVKLEPGVKSEAFAASYRRGRGRASYRGSI